MSVESNDHDRYLDAGSEPERAEAFLEYQAGNLDAAMVRAHTMAKVAEFAEAYATNRHTIIMKGDDLAFWFWEGQTPEEILNTKRYLVMAEIASWAWPDLR